PAAPSAPTGVTRFIRMRAGHGASRRGSRRRCRPRASCPRRAGEPEPGATRAASANIAPMPPDRDARPAPGGSLLLLPGILWGLTLLLGFGFFVPPRPTEASQFLVLGLLAGLTGCWHAGLLVSLSTATRRAGLWTDTVLAVAAGAAYGLLGMS